MKPTKMYYSITEVADLTGLKPHILRYWETEFTILHPKKNRAGNRAYRKKDIETVKLIKRLLYTEGYTIEGAKRQIAKLRKEGYKPGQPIQEVEKIRRLMVKPTAKKDKLPKEAIDTLKEIRSELQEILSLLGT
ncbi:MAG: MerR family transcriptional regulator [bacterium]